MLLEFLSLLRMNKLIHLNFLQSKNVKSIHHAWRFAGYFISLITVGKKVRSLEMD
jgi:hypothetical protein